MNREEVFAKIVEAIDPLDEITEDTLVADCKDIDSLALFSIIVYLKKLGKQYSLTDLCKCVKVSDFVDLALK